MMPDGNVAFLDELKEQPHVLRRVVEGYNGELRAPLTKAASLVKQYSSVLLVGMGSSHHAAEVLVQRLSGTYRASVWDAGELYHYYSHLLQDENVLCIAISQSGESAETCAVAEILPPDAPLIAITNNEESRLALRAELVLPLLAGPEEGTSSKTFIATLVVLHLLADAVLGAELLSVETAGRLGEHMEELIPIMTLEARQFQERMADAHSIVLVGRGPGIISARQGALILQEMTRIPCSGISGGQFRHGPLEAVGPHVALVIFGPGGKTAELLTRLAYDTAGFQSPTWFITDQSVEVDEDRSELFVSRLSSVAEPLSPILSILGPELLGVALAESKGLEPGRFTRISKVTDFE